MNVLRRNLDSTSITSQTVAVTSRSWNQSAYGIWKPQERRFSTRRVQWTVRRLLQSEWDRSRLGWRLGETDVSFGDRRLIDIYSASTYRHLGSGDSDRHRNATRTIGVAENGELLELMPHSIVRLQSSHIFTLKSNLENSQPLYSILLLSKVSIDKYNTENDWKVI